MSTFSLPDTITLLLSLSRARRSLNTHVCVRVFKLVRPHVHGRCHCLYCRLPPSLRLFFSRRWFLLTADDLHRETILLCFRGISPLPAMTIYRSQTNSPGIAGEKISKEDHISVVH